MAMIECKGVVRPLPSCPVGQWEIKFTKQVPYVCDGAGESKKWAMSFFQENASTGGEAAKDCRPLNICLDKVDFDDQDNTVNPVKKVETPHPSSAKTTTAPVRDVAPPGVQPVGSTVGC